MCGRWGIRHCRGAPTWTHCHSVLLFSTGVYMFLILWVLLYEEGRIVSWGLGILNTAKQKELPETSFAVTKKKSFGNSREGRL